MMTLMVSLLFAATLIGSLGMIAWMLGSQHGRIIDALAGIARDEADRRPVDVVVLRRSALRSAGVRPVALGSSPRFRAAA